MLVCSNNESGKKWNQDRHKLKIEHDMIDKPVKPVIR